MKEQERTKGSGTFYAINKTAGKAFRRSGEDAEWEPVDPKSISSTGSSMERAGHEKIGNNWFSVYKAGSQGK
jgi:hypothetical protein